MKSIWKILWIIFIKIEIHNSWKTSYQCVLWVIKPERWSNWRNSFGNVREYHVCVISMVQIKIEFTTNLLILHSECIYNTSYYPIVPNILKFTFSQHLNTSSKIWGVIHPVWRLTANWFSRLRQVYGDSLHVASVVEVCPPIWKYFRFSVQ